MSKRMHKGISLYPGLDRSATENLARLEQAAVLGFTDLFVSFHIPETDEGVFAEQVAPLLARAAALGIRTTGDFVPGKKVPDNLTCLRLDDGFTPEAIADLQAQYPLKILVLNASAITEFQLQAMEEAGVILSRVEALHNFYPHAHTGLSETYFRQQNDLLHSYGVKVGAFVASQQGHRGPLYEGLPTMEKDRHRAVRLAAQHALLLGADAIYMGDDGPGKEELQTLASLEPDVVTLDLEMDEHTPIHDILITHVYETRPDESEEVIRTTNSRALWKNIEIPARPADTSSLFSLRSSLPIGTLTLDTDAYGRYKGELEITLTEVPSDPRVTVLGHIPEEELFLLSYLRGGKKFRICLE